MLEFIQGLFRSDFLPHGWCYRWDPGVVWLHVTSDLLIALAYYFIPFSLIGIVRRRGDLAYPWMFWLFGIFILACGTTHLMSVLVVWQPWYRLDGAVKLITALASVPTAILLLRLSPALVSLPSPEQLRVANQELQREIAERKAAEVEARSLAITLELRVAERTHELQDVNQRLRESEDRLRSILNSMPVLVFLKDLEGRYIFVNRELEKLYQHPADDMIGKTDQELFPEQADTYRKADAEVLATQEPGSYEEVAVFGGEQRTFVSIKFPLLRENRTPYALCGVSTDISARIAAEQALLRYTTELERFAFVAAHDLQEPLRTVKSYTQLLGRRYRGQLDADADEFIGYVTGGVDRMQELIRGLQSWSEPGRDREEMDPIPFNQIVSDTLTHMEASIHEAGAAIACDDLPVLRASRTRMEEVFQNLISNAIRFKSDRPLRVHISAVRSGLEWEFTVEDNGVGFDMQYADQIFGLFRRLHGRKTPGAGVGLAICRKIVESHGGRIWVTSQPGAGAQFHFTLPG